MRHSNLDHGLAVLERRTTAARVLLGCYIAVALLALACSAGTLIVAPGPDHPLAQAAVLSAVALLIVYLICAVVVAMWIHRAHANLLAAGLDGLEYTPGWSIGWFFVPVACLFKPFEAMRELWERSHMLEGGPSHRTDYRLIVWWTCYLASSFAGMLTSLTIEAPAASTALTCAMIVTRIGAAWFMLQIINGVARAQASDLDVGYAFA